MKFNAAMTAESERVMGTRNLICVFTDGEYKIAQYGQWDGYPSGQGVSVLDFISDAEKVTALKNNLSKVRFLDTEGIDKEFYEEYSKNTPEWSSEPDNRTTEQKRWFQSYMSRDLGSDILSSIANSTDDEILIGNSIDFAGDSLFCEFCYVVDFDKKTFEIYSGFNHDEVDSSERFADSPVEDGKDYKQVRHVKTYSLDELPQRSQFTEDLEPKDDDE